MKKSTTMNRKYKSATQQKMTKEQESDNQKQLVVSVPVSDELHETLREYAFKNRETKASSARKILMKFFNLK